MACSKTGQKVFAVCKCFYEKNIFVGKWQKHVTFENEVQFLRDYSDKDDVQSVMTDCRKEVERRRQVRNNAIDRRKLTLDKYSPLHPEIYSFNEKFLDPRFLQEVMANPRDSVAVNDIGGQIYCFPLFTAEFCRLLVQEMKHFEASGVPYERPNSMNRYGMILDEIGFENFVNELRTFYLQPLVQQLYPEMRDVVLDSHKAFVVKYCLGEDIDLAAHFDNAEITLNISISEDHEGGEIVFYDQGQFDGQWKVSSGWEHEFAKGILHMGSKVHQALPIVSGERWNMIVWMRSSDLRNRQCPMCKSKPRKVEAPFFGDGFTIDEC